MAPIPVILVTGFLGSGKTTYLQRLAAARPDLRLVFLVNEFSDTNVDAQVLAEAGGETQSVVGGSLFCECKAGEFVRVMRERIRPMHDDAPLDGVVIETSGIADPEAIGRVFDQHRLTEDFEVRGITSIVAPGKFLKLIGNLPNIAAQIRTSDLVIVNKTDLSEEDEVAAVEARIREVNPSAEIVRASYCAVDVELAGGTRRLPLGELATSESNPYSTRTCWIDHVLPMEALRQWLVELDDAVLRVKGAVLTDAGWFRVEKTVDGVEVTPRAKPAERSCLVMIVPDEAEEVVEKYAAVLKAMERD